MWSDLLDLKRRRKKNIQRLLARNSYLFDNNKSYITWLICEDWKFREKLIKIYGYDREARFNQCFLNLYKTENIVNDHELGYYLFYKDKNNLQIRQGILQTIKNNFEENKVLIRSLMIFCNYLLFDDVLTVEYVKEDVLKIFAYLSNELDVFHNLDQNKTLPFMGIYREFVGSDEWKNIKKYYESKNYFNLINLKRVIDYTDSLTLENYTD